MLHVPPLVPKRNISAPPYTGVVELQMMAARYKTEPNRIDANFSTTISLPYNDKKVEAANIATGLYAEEQCITLLLIAIHYRRHEQKVLDLRWLPCGIVAGYVS